MRYPVSNIFRSLQGEGHFVGYPMVFVRLAGCSVLQCHIRAECDEAPWKAKETLHLDDIITRVRELQPTGIVCITGGEPTDHDLVPLVARLVEQGFRVHLETSGARPVVGLTLEWMTVSPKVLTGEGLKQRHGHVLKIVVRPEWDSREAWAILGGIDAGTDFLHRYLQPLTVDGRPVNTKQVSDMLLGLDGYAGNSNARWAMSSQAHRHWNLP